MRLAILPILLALSSTARAEAPLRLLAYDEAGRQVHAGRAIPFGSEGYVLAARRMMPGARRLELLTPDGKKYPVRWVAAEDPGAGLVKLWAEGLTAEPLVPSTGALELQGTLQMEGKTATVRRMRDVPGSGIVAELDTTSEEDLSGSPLYDEHQRVSALLLPQFLGTRYVAFCVPFSHGLEMPAQPLITVEEWAARHDRAAEESYQAALGQIWGEYYDNAARNLEEVVLAKRDFPEAWFHLGYAHAKLGHVDEKIRYYQRAIALKPDYADAHFSLGVSLLLAGKRDDATKEAQALRNIGASAMADKLSQMIETIHIDGIGKHEEVI
jgi:tetratricopeptide (TPR) repeat protein